ncbi:hypothetical protein Pelo_7251 [Pelomyxa schiedti]|nr:hypothetical protein Pelo_7251 [Pelomyxa schiedti]
MQHLAVVVGSGHRNRLVSSPRRRDVLRTTTTTRPRQQLAGLPRRSPDTDNNNNGGGEAATASGKRRRTATQGDRGRPSNQRARGEPEGDGDGEGEGGNYEEGKEESGDGERGREGDEEEGGHDDYDDEQTTKLGALASLIMGDFPVLTTSFSCAQHDEFLANISADLVITFSPLSSTGQYIVNSSKAAPTGISIVLLFQRNMDMLKQIQIEAGVKFTRIGIPQPTSILQNIGDIVACQITALPVAISPETAEKASSQSGTQLIISRALALLSSQYVPLADVNKPISFLSARPNHISLLFDLAGPISTSNLPKSLDLMGKKLGIPQLSSNCVVISAPSAESPTTNNTTKKTSTKTGTLTPSSRLILDVEYNSAQVLLQNGGSITKANTNPFTHIEALTSIPPFMQSF